MSLQQGIAGREERVIQSIDQLSTLWSLVFRANEVDGEDRKSAGDRWRECYAGAVYRYLGDAFAHKAGKAGVEILRAQPKTSN